MKYGTAFLAALVWSLQCYGFSVSPGPPRPVVAATGEWLGEKYHVVVEPQKVAQHDPEHAGLFLSFDEVVKIARGAFKGLIGDSHEKWHLIEVRLARAEYGYKGNASFYYLVRFECNEPDTVSSVLSDGVSVVTQVRPTLPIVVYPSGISVLPQKAPNKAPEPTPGAVTPRATEGVSK